MTTESPSGEKLLRKQLAMCSCVVVICLNKWIYTKLTSFNHLLNRLSRSSWEEKVLFRVDLAFKTSNEFKVVAGNYMLYIAYMLG